MSPISALLIHAVCLEQNVAGEAMTCSKAGEVAAKMKKAMDTVAISYKVGDKTCQCPTEAKTIATEKKLKTLFVVDKEETECEQTARLNLARAKYKAALLAMNPPAKAEGKDELVLLQSLVLG